MTSRHNEIDSAVDRLDDALRRAGLPPLEPATDEVSLADVDEAVAPYELPPDVRRFWELVDPSSLAVRAFPDLIGPAASLKLHHVELEDGATVPNVPPSLLFRIGYASHVSLSTELASTWGPGGTIFRWAYDEDSFRIVYRTLVDLLDVLTELVSEERMEHNGGFVFLPDGADEAKKLERLRRAGPHPLYGDSVEIPSNLEAWPQHWLEASRIDLRDRMPLGATHTIVELVAAAAEGPVTGRIAGTVTRLVGIGRDTVALVDDGTRPVDVWCPSGTSPWGPVHKRRFEFEVTVEGPVPAPPELEGSLRAIDRHARAWRRPEAEAADAAFSGDLERHRPSAVATDIRPLD
ncbi:MAG: hypothetical protein ACRDPZ_10800 [Gaiellaceae bacterium]